jgi:autotransporter-associated beta strand protein
VTADHALGLGTITLNGGTLRAGANVGLTNLTVDLAAPVSTIDTNGFTLTYAGIIEDAALGSVLTKTGAGTLLLTGTQNNFANATVNQGVLRGGATNAFSPNSAVSLVTTGTLDVGGFNQTIASLAGDSTGVVTNSGATNARLTTGNATSTTFAGVLQDGSTAALGLTKVGTGLFTLTGANTYTGATTVNSGELRINGSLANTTAAVNNGGTLSGIGSIAGAVTVNAGGTLSAGQSPGTLTVGALTLNAGAFSNFELNTPGVVGGATNDLVNVTSSLALGGALNATAASIRLWRHPVRRLQYSQRRRIFLSQRAHQRFGPSQSRAA